MKKSNNVATQKNQNHNDSISNEQQNYSNKEKNTDEEDSEDNKSKLNDEKDESHKIATQEQQDNLQKVWCV